MNPLSFDCNLCDVTLICLSILGNNFKRGTRLVRSSFYHKVVGPDSSRSDPYIKVDFIDLMRIYYNCLFIIEIIKSLSNGCKFQFFQMDEFLLKNMISPNKWCSDRIQIHPDTMLNGIFSICSIIHLFSKIRIKWARVGGAAMR